VKFSTSQFLEMLKQEKSYIGRLFTFKKISAVLNLIFCAYFFVLLYMNEGGAPAPRAAFLSGALCFLMNAAYFFYAWRQHRMRVNLERCWDPVTGVWSRLYFDGILEEELARAGRYRYPLALCLLDIDNFSSFNESFGRRKGDQLLQQFTRYVKGNIRASDLLGRYNEDSFFLLFTHADVVRSEKVISRLWDQSVDKFDCSFRAGIAGYCAGENKGQFVERAQIALEQAKKANSKKIICLVGHNEGQAVIEF
jgi:diguanylate cyclase (GGDEF)-like protein